MLVLSIRTDKPQAELYLHNGKKKLASLKWQADRQLTTTINQKINELLDESSIKLNDLAGIVCYEGPGSFTGLRIGLSLANALAYSQDIPIVSETGENWVSAGIDRIKNGENEKITLPKYGAPAKASQPNK